MAGMATTAVIASGLLVAAQPASADAPPASGGTTTVQPEVPSGEVVGWSRSFHRQVAIPAEAQSGVIAIAAGGGGHALALKTDGSVVGWGPNISVPVPAEAKSDVIAIAAGVRHALALKSDTSVVAWADGSNAHARVPEEARSGVVAIEGSYWNSMVLKSDGSVFVWGGDEDDPMNAPATTRSDVKAIAAGRNHMLALKTDNSVVAWGHAFAGSTVVVPPEALSDVKAIDAGLDYSLALKLDGSVVAWGTNDGGVTTVPDEALSGVEQIVAGTNHAFAIKTDGTIVGWGSPADGALEVPDRVRNSERIQLAAGTGFSLALLTQKAPALTASTPPTEVPVHAPVSYRFSAAGAPAPQFTVASGSLPAGLSLDPVSGVLSGTPTETGVSRFSVRAANGFGADAVTGTLTITVVAVAQFTAQTPPAGRVGTGFAYTFAASGYPQPTFSVGSGALPAGLSLNRTTGRLAGTPIKAGQWTFTVRAATGTALTTDSAPITMTVDPSPQTGKAAVTAAPASVVPGAWENQTTVQVFAERLNQTLAAPLSVGGATIPAGSRVNVYYLHADPVGTRNVATPYAASIWFGTQILGIATTTADLVATNQALGTPGTVYPNASVADQGLEPGDTVTVVGTTTHLSLTAYNTSDSIRVITVAP